VFIVISQHLKRYEGSGPAQRMDAYICWKDLHFTSKDLQLFTEKYQKALRQLDTYGMTLSHDVMILTLHVTRLGAPRCVYHLPHLHSFNNQASTSLTHELRVYDLINRVALFYSTWADIKRESLRSVTLSITSPLDDALPSIDDLVKDLLDQDVEMERQDQRWAQARKFTRSLPRPCQGWQQALAMVDACKDVSELNILART
jgi:hypothetical protein